ncbi:Sfb3 protein [Martiniozyma asiatica (nom. inval.)]|nr:Sfb3 protein [Martiniozyma asiatica]
MDSPDPLSQQFSKLEVSSQRKGGKRRVAHVAHDLGFASPHADAPHNFDPNMAATAVGLGFPPTPTPNAAGEQNVQFQQEGFVSSSAITNQFNVTNSPLVQETFDQAATSDVYNINEGIADNLKINNSRSLANAAYIDKRFLSFEHVSPPPAGTQYIAYDQQNATPKFARFSMYSIPDTADLREKSKIPFAMELRPFAELAAESSLDDPVPQIDVKNISRVPRCNRCRAYLCPGMITTGDEMTCSICGFKSQLPPEYICHVYGGKRDDFDSRQELFKGVVDYIVPETYNWNEKDTRALHRVFLIDMSYEAYLSKAVEAMCGAIRTTLYGETGESLLPEGSTISIIGYDNRLHFYDLSANLEQTTVAYVGDLDDPFLPFFGGLYADPTTSNMIIDQTLQSIEQTERYSKKGIAFGAALTAAALILEEVGGGQIISSLSQMPQYEPGKLVQKIANDTNQLDFINSICTPDNKFYQQLLTRFIKNNISLNIFIVATQGIDLGNLGNLTYKTGGILKDFLFFDINRDEFTFIYAVKEAVLSVAGYQCQFKTRCSHGLQVLSYHGVETESGADAPLIPVVSANTSIVCEFGYNNKLSTAKDAHFQTSFLYTSSDGVRKVRVINSILSVSSRLHDIFAFADEDTIVKYLLNNSLPKFSTGSLVALRNSLLVDVVNMLSSYRVNVIGNNAFQDVLVTPQSLQTLSMKICFILKSRAYLEKISFPDLRLESYFNLLQMSSSQMSAYLTPFLFCLHDLQDTDCMITSETGLMNIPEILPLSSTQLQIGGAYLLFNGSKIIIWLHTDVNPALLHDLFGEYCDSIEQVIPFIGQLPYLDSHISLQVRNLCRFLAKQFNNYDLMSIEVCRFGIDKSEMEFKTCLLEDRSHNLDASFSDFLKNLATQINKKVTSSLSKSAPKNDNISGADGHNLSNRFGIF